MPYRVPDGIPAGVLSVPTGSWWTLLGFDHHDMNHALGIVNLLAPRLPWRGVKGGVKTLVRNWWIDCCDLTCLGPKAQQIMIVVANWLHLETFTLMRPCKLSSISLGCVCLERPQDSFKFASSWLT